MYSAQRLNQVFIVENSEIWRSVYSTCPLPTLITDTDENVLDINVTAKKFFRIESENIANQTLESLLQRLGEPLRSLVRISRVAIEIGNHQFWVVHIQDINDHSFSERLLNFFATTLKALDFPTTLSLNLDSMLKETIMVALKGFADWCRIDLLDGTELKLQSMAQSKFNEHTICDIDNEYSTSDSDDPLNPLKVIRSGAAVFVPNISADLLIHQPFASKAINLFLQAGINSYISVPIKNGHVVLGSLSFGRSAHNALFNTVDLIMAEEFATKVGFNVERAQLYKNLEQLKCKADAANQAKTNFLANVSHEIRTPLGAIVGFSELLTESDPSSADFLNWKQKIRSNCGYLLRIIDDILDLSKIEAGKLNTEIEKLDFKRLLSNVYETAKDRITDKPVKLEFELSETMPRFIYSDETRLSQILNNIIGNAVKFTNEGYVRVIISWSQKNNQLLQFEIEDSGIGISQIQSPNLFKPFNQADASFTRQFGGTGLGLALSRNLARELGGDVTLQTSQIGRGSRFQITIDPGKVNKSDGFTEFLITDPLDFDEEKISLCLPLSEQRVLLVEDSIDIQILIKRFLEAAGAHVTCAVNGLEGMEIAMSSQFDAVLMDVQMPIKDGCEATKDLRMNGYKGLIIALTAHAMKEEYDSCTKAGYDAHLSKPIRRKDLICNLLKLINDHKRRL
ncbi:MAG: ATP-binding protein [Bdellovibrio sp.]